jgi:hypothetical protein
LPSGVGRIARVLRLLAQGLVTTAAATGLLYLVRAHLPATPIPIRDALSLDELPGHDTVSLLLLALIWILVAAAVLLATTTAQRPSLPLTFALGTFFCSFAGCAVSLKVVRQTTTVDALTATAAVPAVYIEGLLAAIAAILTARISAARSQA